MSLTGMQIFKYLPAAKKAPEANCKACGQPTCMAYALKLAKKQADAEKCPHVPPELKEKLLEAAKIQQHVIKLSDTLVTGGENVMYRHDRTFINRTVIAVALDCDDTDFEKKLKRIADYRIERIGETFKVDAIALLGEGEKANAAKLIEQTGMAVISYENPNYTIVKGSDTSELETESKKTIAAGNKDILLELDIDNKPLARVVEELTYIRHAAIIDRYEPFTYPVMVRIGAGKDLYDICALASVLVCKYANVIVLDTFDEALVSTLFTLRQNIYTNPQKPLQVEAKVYKFNDPDRKSPILLTTNFALTYFAVAGELESLPFGSYLVVTPSDGMSVLTAWSADKFTAELVARSIRNYGLLDKVDTRKIIIPGLLSHMQEELQEALPEWQIVIGTIEACQIPVFLKSM